MRIPGADEQTKEFEDHLIEGDEYRVRIVGWKEYVQPIGLYNKTEEDRVLFRLEVLHQVDDPEAEVLDKDSGEPLPEDFTLPFFYDPKRTGIWNGKVAKSRKFLYAALNHPIEENIEFDSYDDLVGKEVIASVIVAKNSKGEQVNRIESVRPVKKAKKKEEAPAVKAAKEVFKDEVKAEEDSDY